MKEITRLKGIHPWVWLRRFRYRRGYGVHSPFAFSFLTFVVYEKAVYYKYKELDEAQQQQASLKGDEWAYAETRKLKRLLFRIANWAQPQQMVDVGPESAAELFLKAARTNADWLKAENMDELRVRCTDGVEFLYLHDYRHPAFVREAFQHCVAKTSAQSVFVIAGIGYSTAMKELWQQIKQHPKTGISFDLYDVGVVCFDPNKIKQHYIVNF